MEGKDAVIISACESASLINESFIQFDRISFPASTSLHLREIYLLPHVSIRGGPCCTDWSSLVFIKLKIHDKDH